MPEPVYLARTTEPCGYPSGDIPQDISFNLHLSANGPVDGTPIVENPNIFR